MLRVMRACRECGADVAAGYRFCPWCAAPLRRKLVEFFFPPPLLERDRGKALRVSRYLDEGHVRFSVWDERGEARAAISLSPQEAERLAGYLLAGARRRAPRSGQRLSLRR